MTNIIQGPLGLSDEEMVAVTVGNGRAAAARAIVKILHGNWDVVDPLNLETTTLLVSTFRILSADSRDIFREAVQGILHEAGDAGSKIDRVALSTLLYVAQEISLPQRLPSETLTSLLRLLRKATNDGDPHVEQLALKYIAAGRLANNIAVWKRLHHETSGRHSYVCFMGMARTDLSSSLIWISRNANDSDLRLVIDFGVPALVEMVGGAQVRRALLEVMQDLQESVFSDLADSLFETFGLPEERRRTFLTPDVAAPHTVSDISSTPFPIDSAEDEGLRRLAIEWDRPTVGPDSLPPKIASLLSGAYRVAA